MASLWQKNNGTWCVTYREGGKQRARSLRTKDRREALKSKRAIETTLDERGTVVLRVFDAPPAEFKNPTFDEFWASFHEWAIAHRSAWAIEEYGVWFRSLRNFVDVERLGDVTSVDIEAFKASLMKQGKRKPKGIGLTATTINNALKTLNSLWNHAVKLGVYTGGNPISKIERLRTPKMLDRDYLGKDQVDALLKVAREHGEEKYIKKVEATNVYLAIALMALAGLRKREASFARWEWIDWTKRIILVTNDNEFTTKNRQPRIISLNVQLMDILMPYRKSAGYILEILRPSNNKTHYRVDFKKSFQRVCDLAGIQTTPHQLRHSFASRHAVAGTSLHVIAGWLGHSTTWITQRYAHFQKTFNAAADNI